MTDRVRTISVVLTNDLRADDAEQVLNAIRMLKGVQIVSLGPAVEPDDYVARQVVSGEVGNTLRYVADALSQPSSEKWEQLKSLLS